MTGRFGRLLHLGNVVVDIVLDVPALPERGGDVLATGSVMTPGGGFNVMVAAARQGLPVAYAGAYGSGPFAALARAALADAGITILQPPKAGIDTGFVVSIVDAEGERTFVTSRGAEATLTTADLGGISAAPGDASYLSGYGLVHPSNRAALLGWLGRLPPGHAVFADPGPLVQLIPPDVMERVLGRADWWTCNAREAALLTGRRIRSPPPARSPAGPARAGCWSGPARTAACSAAAARPRCGCRASTSTSSTPTAPVTRIPGRSSPPWPAASTRWPPRARRTRPRRCR